MTYKGSAQCVPVDTSMTTAPITVPFIHFTSSTLTSFFFPSTLSFQEPIIYPDPLLRRTQVTVTFREALICLRGSLDLYYVLRHPRGGKPSMFPSRLGPAVSAKLPAAV